MGCCNSKMDSNDASIIAQTPLMIDEKEMENTFKSFEFIPHIILMGDSVLDNKAWLENFDERMDVCKQLNIALKKYNNQFIATNLAVDGMTTQSLLFSLKKPNHIQPKRFTSLDSFLNDNEFNRDTHKPIVLLSVGGNDVLGSMYENSDAFDKKVVNNLKTQEFMNKYTDIINIILNDYKCDIIVVFCYEPHCRFTKKYNIKRSQLLNIMEFAMKEIFKLCESKCIPIIDLARTTDTYDINHYSSASPIEPNENTGLLLTDLVLYLLCDYYGNNWDKSKIYFGRKNSNNPIQSRDNNDLERQNWLQNKLSITPNK